MKKPDVATKKANRSSGKGTEQESVGGKMRSKRGNRKKQKPKIKK